MKFIKIEYTLPAFWLPALINDDWSGLTLRENLQITQWLQKHDEEMGEGHWATLDEGCYFTRFHDALDVAPEAGEVERVAWMKRISDREEALCKA